jgi:hypothetical protein
MTELQVRVSPQIQVVFADGDEHTFYFSEAVREREDYDPATISDGDLLQLAARHLDRDMDAFSHMKVRRPETGNIVIAPQNVFGLWRG